MKIISLNCNHCGAPLDVPARAKFVTCTFCESKLSIQHTGSTWSTEVLEELQKTTQTLASDVRQLQLRSDLDQLDRDWDKKKQQYFTRNRDGSTSVPSGTAAVIGAIGALGFGIFWVIMTSAGNAPPFFPLFGVLFSGVAIVHMIIGVSKANRYKSAHSRYQRQRRNLMSDRNDSV